MECEGVWKPCSFDFTFILHAEGVNDIIMNVSDFYFETWCYSKLSVFSSVLPLSLYDMLLVTCRETSLSTWFVHVPIAIYPRWWFLLFALTWVLPSYTFLSFFFGCFVLLMFVKFSLIATNVMCTMTNGWWVDEKHILGFNSSLNHCGWLNWLLGY